MAVSARGRDVLDERLSQWRTLPAGGARPHAGWIRAIRDALRMTSSDLATRLGVAQPTVARLEASERDDRIQLDSLRRVADALDCDLVYALVPRRSLQETVDEQIRKQVHEQLQRLQQTMSLEDQALTGAQQQAQYERLNESYATSRGLWRTNV